MARQSRLICYRPRVIVDISQMAGLGIGGEGGD